MSKGLFKDDYIAHVKKIVEDIYPSDQAAPSIFRDTTDFFVHDATSTNEQLDLKIKIADLEDAIEFSLQDKTTLQAELGQLVQHLDVSKRLDVESRFQRIRRVRMVCNAIFTLCEGHSHAETQQKTAKFMSALWFISEQHQSNLQHLHHRLKVVYKLVLTLRFVDIIIEQQLASVPNWQSFTDLGIRYTGLAGHQAWFSSVAMPVMMASLFQDSGLQHPLAVKLLDGEDNNANPFRVLEPEERIQLLKMNYRFSIDYVTLGLGPDYSSNYASPEQQLLSHATTIELVKDAYKPVSGIGEILKIPQIYASVVFSIKQGFARENVPKGCILIDQLGKQGVLQPQLAQAFFSMTGLFPQGFGIVSDQFKGIVYGLHPIKPQEPHVVTVLDHANQSLPKTLLSLRKNENFYFEATRKKHKCPPPNRHWLASRQLHQWVSIWRGL